MLPWLDKHTYILRIVLFLFLCNSSISLSAQKKLKIVGEVELLEQQLTLQALDITFVNRATQEKVDCKLKSAGTFEARLDLQEQYDLFIKHPGFYDQAIQIDASISDTSQKIWPVYIKSKLRPDSLPKLVLKTLISYDSSLKRFDQKTIEGPYFESEVQASQEEPVDSNSSQIDTLSELIDDYEALKKLKAIQDQKIKSLKDKSLSTEFVKYRLKNQEHEQKLEMLAKQIEQRISQKRTASNLMYRKMLIERAKDAQSAILSAQKKRKLIEEIAETKKITKIQKRNYILD